MDEVLKKLLESELLSEETRAEISEQWAQSVDAFKQQIREEETLKLRGEFSQQWLTERDELVSKVDTFVAEALERELAELQGDIEEYRDLKAEMAKQLVEEKHRLAEEVAKDLDELVDKIDQFFEIQLSKEFDDLREDLELVKQNEFGRKIFEAFVNTYASHYIDEASVQKKLAIAESTNTDLKTQLAKLETERAQMLREAEMEKVLSPLTGKKREQMAMVLKTVETAKLQESYNYFIGRLLKEDAAPAAKTLTEAAATPTTVVTGNGGAVEPAQAPQADKGLEALKRLAGVKSA